MIYIINSARDSLSNHIRRDLSLERHILLICDECRHYQSKENRKIFMFTEDMSEREKLYRCISLSATPFGTGNDRILLKALGKEIYRYDYNIFIMSHLFKQLGYDGRVILFDEAELIGAIIKTRMQVCSTQPCSSRRISGHNTASSVPGLPG